MNDPIDSKLEQIAKRHLGLETLEQRGRDALDFHELAVWKLRDALREAFEAGAASVKEGA